MFVCKSVTRSVRLSGSCGFWFPLVKNAMCKRGYRNVSVDDSRFCLTADYGDSFVPGKISVALAPSAFCGDTDVIVTVTPNLGDAPIPVEMEESLC